MSDAPSWLNDDVPPSGGGGGGGSSSAQGLDNGLSSANAKDQEEDGPKYKTVAQMTLAFINIGVCVFMAATGVLGISGAVKKEEEESDQNGELAVTDVFVGTYMVLFALILFCYEVAYVTKIETLNMIMKRNFGFLYGVIGKCSYIIFMAILVFGLSQPRTLVLACGIIVACWAPVQLLYYMRFPDHFDKVTKYDPREDGLVL
jgi:hypothetical protein